jgi:hypothetical protein
MAFSKAVIPDKALERLSLADVASYRRKTKDIYDAWIADLNATAAKIDELSVEEVSEKAPQPATLRLSDLEGPFSIEWAQQPAAFGFAAKPFR